VTASAVQTRHSPVAIRQSPLVSVCSEIGRGHPSYLDSVMLALDRLQAAQPPGLVHDPNLLGLGTQSQFPDGIGLRPASGHVPRLTVPELCVGTSGLAWGLARLGYRLGAQGGAATWIYNRLRNPDAHPPALQLSLLGSGLRQVFAGYKGICVVDHPLLAHILATVCRVAYVHGEIAAPRVSAVPDAWRTFVPVEATMHKLEAFGVKSEAVCVTGLIVEPELVAVAGAAFEARLRRFEAGGPLLVGLFISGARPRPHVNRIAACVESLAKCGHRSVLFWGPGMLHAARMQSELGRRDIPAEAARVIWARDRGDETTRTAELLPSLDVMVAAAHERTNWAVGLGLPLFALLPHIGPFARENFESASEQGACLTLASSGDAAAFGSTLDALRGDGGLAAMARAGWGRHPITGADAAARELLAGAASR
jgi:hypothetical protein